MQRGAGPGTRAAPSYDGEDGDRAGFVRLVRSSRRLARRETEVDEQASIPEDEGKEIHTHGH